VRFAVVLHLAACCLEGDQHAGRQVLGSAGLQLLCDRASSRHRQGRWCLCLRWCWGVSRCW
jgi:hypothetical protein